MYFTLKDETASIKCVMFAGNARSLDFTPYSGQSVIVHGSVNVYERDGANQIYVTDMIERGQGELALAYEKAKRELEAGGYFNKKRPIPKQPKKVCLITAEKGAALQDMLNIIDRGGGSAEDLSCFNDVGYAKALYNSEIPTISAVGHETDFTISDFVADFRAPTPSAAAEIATAVTCDDLSEHIELVYDSLSDIIHSKTDSYEQLIDSLQRHISAYSPGQRIERSERELVLISGKIRTATDAVITKSSVLLDNYSDKIEALSPINVLKRGYSAVTKNNSAVNSIADIEQNDTVEILFADGTATAQIKEIHENNKECFR